VPIVAVRAAGLAWGALDIDETDFLLIARMMLAGEIPYVGTVDIKPVLVYLFYAPSALSGFHMWPMQILAMGWVFATSLVVGKAAREWTGRAEAAWAGAWLACLAQTACVPAVNSETMLNLPAAGALYLFVRAERTGRLRHDLLAGVCVALASLFRHQAGILLVAFLGAFAWARAGRGRLLARTGALLLGFAIPWAAAASVYAGLGHLDAFIDWNVTRNLLYSGAGAGPALPRLLGGLALGILLAAPLQWALAIRETRGLLRGPEREPVRVGLALALWLTFVPVSLGARFYGHYFIQFAPVVALFATPGALRLLDGWRTLPLARRRALALALALPVAIFLGVSWIGGILGRFPLQEPRTRELAAWISAHTSPHDRIAVWGHYSPIYVLAERLSGSRYHNTSIQIGNFDPHHLPEGFDLSPYVSERDVEILLGDLEAKKPVIFVDTAPSDIHDWARVPLRVVPRLQRYVEDHYALVARPGGSAVYQRR